MLKKLTFLLIVCLSMVAVSCGGGKGQTKAEKEYAKFQTDSIYQCTQNVGIVKTAVESAFDRIPENNGYWKKDKVTCVYNDSLKLWEGTVDYHYDRSNTYYKSSVKFQVKYWAEQDGDKAKVFYTVRQI